MYLVHYNFEWDKHLFNNSSPLFLSDSENGCSDNGVFDGSVFIISINFCTDSGFVNSIFLSNVLVAI